MSGFITKAACIGRRPSQFASYAGYQRVSLISRLLRERSIARFVVAPAGYGKTSLLVDYAETMFSWVHVFWINGQSPCFIRDLDEGTIARDCRAHDAEVRLVVFDDVPALDAARAQAFSRQIDELLAAKCEVIVACTPCSDVYGQLQRDRLRIGAREMLLDDDELDTARGAEERMRTPSSQLPDSCRVPVLVWHDTADSAVKFLRDGFKEPMPSDLMFGMATMLVVQSGSIEVLTRLGLGDLQLIDELSQEYPHLGYDAEQGRFLAPDISIDDLAAGLKGGFDGVVARSAFGTREELVCAWADELAKRAYGYGRACDVIRVLCPRGRRGAWLAAHARELVGSSCFLEGLKLAEAVRLAPKDAPASDRASCAALEALCRMLLDDVDGALSLAKRIAFDESSDLAPRVCSLLVLARCGNDTLRGQAEAVLLDMASPCAAVPVESLQPWTLLSASWCKLADVDALAVWWGRLNEGGAPRWVLSLTASWLFSALAGYYEQGAEAGALLSFDDVVAAGRFVRSELVGEAPAQPDYFAVSAGLSLEQARAQGVPLPEGALPASALLVLRQAEMATLGQRARFAREWEVGRARSPRAQGAPASIGMAPGAANAKLVRAVPTLRIRMFGRFELLIGDDIVESGSFRRKHVRLLLLVLSMNLGREMSRDTLAKMLWPEVPDDIARRNFYTAWSKLRKGLALSDGTCPYLQRQRYGCSLDSRYVQCDVARLNDICRELLFGRPDFKGWSALYFELDRDFSNELMPSEESDEIVDRIRAECRARLVDALVSATQSLIDGQNLQLAIWFARAAVGRDETREDAYVALMRAQIANSQRTAAMMTYHTCRRVLADQLGVDPSPETRALYESLLDAI